MTRTMIPMLALLGCMQVRTDEVPVDSDTDSGGSTTTENANTGVVTTEDEPGDTTGGSSSDTGDNETGSSDSGVDAECGNGFQDPGEDCDDGNDIDGDGCEADCSAPSCDNGIVDPGEFCHTLTEEWEELGGLLGGPQAVDLDGDGIVDISLVSEVNGLIHVFLGEAGGGLTRLTDLEIDGAPSEHVVADFDGDEIVDIVTADDFETLRVHTGVGDGTFNPSVTTTDFPRLALGFRAADLDGDGNMDVAGMASDLRSLQVRMGNGDGTFLAADFELPGPDPTQDFLAHDFDGDGELELVFSQQRPMNQSILRVLERDEVGSYAVRLEIEAEQGPWFVMAVTDIDNDGNDDIVGGSLGTGLALALGDGVGGFTILPPVPVDGVFATRLAVADVNSDTWPDVILGYFDSVRLTVALGSEDFSFPQQFVNFGETAGIAVADINGDSVDDVVLAGHTWGEDRFRPLVSAP